VPFRYAWPVDCLIHQLKYRKQGNHARVLGVLLARMAADSSPRLPDILLPVPMHSARLRERGFNHAADIARWCGSELHVEVRASWASRILDTGALAGLSRAEREHRIRGAFAVSERVAGLRIAIVDDVLTTGATASELARELYDTGAAEVELWVIARTAAEA
jgi:ComF family protein